MVRHPSSASFVAFFHLPTTCNMKVKKIILPTYAAAIDRPTFDNMFNETV
jgi:hypothetical protein